VAQSAEILFLLAGGLPVPASCGKGPSANAFAAVFQARARKSRPSSCAGTRALLFVDGNDGSGQGVGLWAGSSWTPSPPSCGDGAAATTTRNRSRRGSGPGDEVITGIFSRPSSVPARRHAGADRAGRVGAPPRPAAGNDEIEREIRRPSSRIRSSRCATPDLDHFKEFNRRYIITTATALLCRASSHDVVRDFWGARFVGHIGGDDFIFVSRRTRSARSAARFSMSSIP